MIRLGIFDLLEPLAKGGMGEVWRGRHRDEGVDAAIKVIRKAHDGESQLAFEREVQAHAGLSHPGVALLFDYGIIDEKAALASGGAFVAASPYLAMEFADGGTLRDLMPFGDWPAVHAVICSVLDALSHAHARRVIHRDLKPENMLVVGSSPRRIKLSDFGIAHALGAEHDRPLHSLHSFSGTPHYIAPEQARSHWRTYGPWTDIYALGCVVYEWVCGRPPFLGDNLLRLVASHCSDERPRLEPRFPIPDELQAWVHRAMHIDPQARFQRAAHALYALPPAHSTLHAALTLPVTSPNGPTRSPTAASPDLEIAFAETIAVSSHQQAPSTEFEPPATPPPPPGDERFSLPATWRYERAAPLSAPLVGAGLGLFGLREIPFVDRDAARDQIWDALREVVEDGEFRVVFVTGGPGAGKSSLARWMACRADEVGAARQLEAVHTPGAPGAIEGLVGLLRRAFRCWKLDRDALYEFLHADLSQPGSEEQFHESDARALTEWLSPRAAEGEASGGPRFRFSSARQRHALAHRLLRRVSADWPCFIWLDDLQWGPHALDTLDHVLHSAAPAPNALVVATLRSDVLAEQPDLAERIDAMLARPDCQRIELSPLATADHRELLTRMLSLDDELVEMLARRTEGNPLFATQLLRHIIDRDQLQAGPRGFRLVEGVDRPMPDDIFALWVGRIDRLVASFPQPERLDTRQAIELAAALGTQVDADEWRLSCEDRGLELSAALMGRLIARGLARETPNGWEFAHGLLVDSLGEQARQARRWQDHHSSCARALDALAQRTGRSTARRRADHWFVAGEYDRAIDALDEAIHYARRRGLLKDSSALVDRRGALMEQLGWRRDDPRRLINDARRAGYLLSMGSGADGALQLATRVCADAARVGADLALATALDVLVRIADSSGKTDRAIALAEEAIEAAHRSRDNSCLGKAYGRLAWTLLSVPDYEGAQQNFRRGLHYGEEAGDSYRTLYDRGGLITIAVQQGHFDAAISQANEVLEPVRQKGFTTIEDLVVNCLGDAAKYVGDLETALESYQASERLIKSLGDSRRVANTFLQQATVYSAKKDTRTGRLLNEFERSAPPSTLDFVSSTVDLVRLANAAGAHDEANFDLILSRFDDGWPDGQYLSRDAPWLAEIAARHCRDFGDTHRAARAEDLARDLYGLIGDHDAVERLQST